MKACSCLLVLKGTSEGLWGVVGVELCLESPSEGPWGVVGVELCLESPSEGLEA